MKRWLLLLVVFLLACQPKPVQEIVLNESSGPEISVGLVNLYDVPKEIIESQTESITWRVDGGTATSSSLFFDTISHPEDPGNLAPKSLGYQQVSSYHGLFELPKIFVADLTSTEVGIIYLRAHALIDDINVWSQEIAVNITNLPDSQGFLVEDVKEFVVEADDRSLSPDNINVSKGDKVRIRFDILKNNVYFGGLDFRSSAWGTTGKILPGNSVEVEFTAVKTFQYRSYWPATNRLKAVGTITVS